MFICGDEFATITFAVLFPSAGSVQSNLVELLRSDVRADAQALIIMALQLAAHCFKLQKDRVKLYRQYHGRVAKAVSPTMDAPFIQVENQLNLIIDLQIAQEMLLVFESEGK